MKTASIPAAFRRSRRSWVTTRGSMWISKAIPPSVGQRSQNSSNQARSTGNSSSSKRIEPPTILA